MPCGAGGSGSGYGVLRFAQDNKSCYEGSPQGLKPPSFGALYAALKSRSFSAIPRSLVTPGSVGKKRIPPRCARRNDKRSEVRWKCLAGVGTFPMAEAYPRQVEGVCIATIAEK
jgi:hypothetical protein